MKPINHAQVKKAKAELVETAMELIAACFAESRAHADEVPGNDYDIARSAVGGAIQIIMAATVREFEAQPSSCVAGAADAIAMFSIHASPEMRQVTKSIVAGCMDQAWAMADAARAGGVQ